MKQFNEIKQQTQSLPLAAEIHRVITERGGVISFAEFMQMALYHPQYGYYNTHAFAPGDFTTAPEMTPLFAQCIAQQVAQVLRQLSSANVLEYGAGSGKLAKDMLLALAELQCLPEHYYIVEISPSLREQQRTLLQTHCPQWLPRIQWLDAPPTAFSGVIIANEVLDALPTHCFEVVNQQMIERGVAYEHGQFVWQLMNAIDFEFTPLPDGYVSEMNLQYASFIASLATHLKQGMILLIDYGYHRSEYYQPERSQGTLKCFYQHHHHDDPLVLVGQQDITTHVDFTRVAEMAVEQGLSVAGYTYQNAFLFACGLAELAGQSMDAIAQYQQSQAIKQLTLPSEMGERVKVMALTRDLDGPWLGFALVDRRRDL